MKKNKQLSGEPAKKIQRHWVTIKEFSPIQISQRPRKSEMSWLMKIPVVHNLIMVTDNIKDFKNIRGIRIEDWIEREK